MPAAIGRNHAKRMKRFVEKDNFILGLYDLDRQGHRSDPGHAHQQTPPAGIVDRPAVTDLLELRLHPVLVRSGLWTSPPAAPACLGWCSIRPGGLGVIRADRERQSRSSSALPDTRQIRFTVGSLRNRRLLG